MTTEQIELVAEAVCNVLTDMDVDMLTDLLRDAIEAADYAAEDYGERADFERTHQGAQEEDYKEAREGYGETAAQLGALSHAIKRQNDRVQGRA